MRTKTNIFTAFIVGLCFSLVVMGALTSGFAFDGLAKAQKLESSYERSFYTLLDSVNNMETDLSKLVVARGNGESVEIMQSVYSNAQTAITGYSGLPIDFNNEYRCLKFFNQVADWSASYIRAVANGGGEKYRENAQSLYETAKTLNDNLKEIASKTEGKKLYTAVGDNLLPKGLEGIDFTLSSPDIEYPTLIYDGPFSDDTQIKAKAIENKKEISVSQAEKVIANALSFEEIKFLGESGSQVVAYEFEGKVNGSYAYCSVTKKGGYVLNFTSNDGKNYENGVGKTKAESVAKIVLNRLGYTNMQVVWYNQVGSSTYLNFAPVINSVIYYTDLVKVRVSGSGKVEGIEASGYLSSFEERVYTPTISKQEVVSSSQDITIKSVCLAVIPKMNDERFCYEIYGEKNGLDYYIYIDAQNGEQVDILRVVDSAQGRKAV